MCHLPALCGHYDSFPTRTPTPQNDNHHRMPHVPQRSKQVALATAAETTRDDDSLAPLAPALLVVVSAAIAGVVVRRRAAQRSWAFKSAPDMEGSPRVARVIE